MNMSDISDPIASASRAVARVREIDAQLVALETERAQILETLGQFAARLAVEVQLLHPPPRAPEAIIEGA